MLQFKCPHCTQRFRYKSLVLRHLVSHTGVQPYACMHCGHRYGSQTQCLQHEALCDGVYKDGQSKVISDAVKQLSNIPTLREATLKPQAEGEVDYKCKFCTKTFMKSRNLRRHILTHNEVKPYRCKACDSCFSRYDHLKVHQTRCRGKRPRLEVRIPKISLDDVGKGWQNKFGIEPAEKKETFECKVCSRSFSTQSKLSRHDTMFHVTKLFKCTRCGSSFAHEKSLKKHSKMNKCRKVSKETNVSLPLGTNPPTENVTKRLDGVRNRVLQRIQPYVNKKFKYVCSYCRRAFGNRWQLGVHTRLHTGEKPYACEYCGQRFIRKDYLQRHFPKCTKKQQQNKMLCDRCGGFFSQVKLENHKKSCTLTPSLSKSIVCQQSSQSPPKGFSCAYCSSRFLLFSQLQEHFLNAHKMETMVPPVSTAPLQHHLSNIPNIKEEPLEESCDERKWHQNEQKDHGSTVEEKSSTEQQSSSQVSTTGDSDEDENNDTEDSESDSAPYFPCHVCGKTFPTSESLEDHQRCHLGEKPHECAECGRCFFQASQLQQHQRMHKSEFQCQACGRGFVSLFALRKHKHTHGKSRPHRCSKCHLSFTGPSQLAEHMSTHREENFPCDICNHVFLSKSSRAEHRKSHSKSAGRHPSSTSREERKKSASLSESSSVFNKELKYRCCVCGERFRDPEELSEHGCKAAKERPYSCSDCNKHFLHASHLKKHRTTHQLSWSSSEYPCNQCNNSFSSPQHFLSHLKSHDDTTAEIKRNLDGKGGGPSQGFICPVCHQCFASATELIGHFPTHPDGIFECKICKMTFPSGSKLEEHERRHLTSATEFECTKCGQSFLGNDTFHQHQCSRQQHAITETEYSNTSGKIFSPCHQAAGEEEEIDVTGEDLFHCPVCSMQFSSKSGLLEHQNKQHPNEKPFKCELCGKTFALRRYLREHVRRHHQKSAAQNRAQWSKSKLKCTEYRTEFNTAQDLSLHMRLQAEKEVGEYRCDMCYKSFSQWSLLKQHQESHVGQVVYECTECDKAFAFPHLLEEHQQTHAGSSQ
ncbi:zinc finger protein 1035 [Enoplosus armatus]|uniref:zinc finger protein 1035 n=1 Tax=Enoplosus armatus TaxID=215367 RepID=UPI003992072C